MKKKKACFSSAIDRIRSLLNLRVGESLVRREALTM